MNRTREVTRRPCSRVPLGCPHRVTVERCCHMRAEVAAQADIDLGADLRLDQFLQACRGKQRRAASLSISNARSTSLCGPASPRAIDPNIQTLLTPLLTQGLLSVARLAQHGAERGWLARLFVEQAGDGMLYDILQALASRHGERLQSAY